MRIAPALLLLVAALPARADVISAKPDKVAVVIYHQGRVDTASLAQDNGDGQQRQGLAMVSETRTIDLPAGVSQVQFRAVAATLVPQTAEVTGLPGVTERNFDFNLLSPGALFAKSVGNNVHLVRTDKQSGATTDELAAIRSGPDGVVLQTPAGVEALDCSGLPERIVFDKLPDNLLDTPTLSVRAIVPRAGRYVVTLRYIATGLNWSADYVARVYPDSRTLDLTGWITLANFSETGFSDAPVEVIAGRLQTTGQDQPVQPKGSNRTNNCWQADIDWATASALTVEVSASRINLMGFAMPAPIASATRVAVRDLGDYKLYALAEPTNVAARQTKQVQFLNTKRVPFRRVYRITANERISDNEIPADVLLQIDNSVQDKLGKPLPAGGISTYESEHGQPLLAGTDAIDDTPVGLPLEIAAGDSLAVSAHARVTENILEGQGTQRTRQRSLEVTITNRKTEAVVFEWRQPLDGLTTKLQSESRRHTTKGGDPLWRFALKPGEQAVLRYRLLQQG